MYRGIRMVTEGLVEVQNGAPWSTVQAISLVV